MVNIWYVRDRGRVMGLFSAEQLSELRESGELKSYTEVSTDSQSWRAFDLAFRPEKPAPTPALVKAAPAAVRIARHKPERDNRGYKIVVGSIVSVICLGLLGVGGYFAINKNPDRSTVSNQPPTGEPPKPKPTTTEPLPPKPEPPLDDEKLFQVCEPSIAFIKGNRGSGTGFLVEKGLLATNAHVVADQFIERMDVTFPNHNTPLKATLVYFDARRDLALLRVDALAPPLTVLRTYECRPAQKIFTIGNPGLGDRTLKSVFTDGKMGKTIDLKNNLPYYQLSMAINPGNSGGPILDQKGQVIGVATLRATKLGNVGFAVPAKDLGAAMEKAKKSNEDDIDRIVLLHRCTVTFTWLRMAGDNYSEALKAYSAEIENAIKNNRDANQALRSVSLKIDKFIDNRNLIRTEDLNTNLSLILSDRKHTDEAVRTRLRNLRETYFKMKNLYDFNTGSRMTFGSFLDSARALQKEHEAHVAALKAEFGIED